MSSLEESEFEELSTADINKTDTTNEVNVQSQHPRNMTNGTAPRKDFHAVGSTTHSASDTELHSSEYTQSPVNVVKGDSMAELTPVSSQKGVTAGLGTTTQSIGNSDTNGGELIEEELDDTNPGDTVALNAGEIAQKKKKKKKRKPKSQRVS